VLEHLANPLAMLVDCYRVLRPGGLLVLLVPDRHQTFDRTRSPTPLTHLIEEHEDDVREVDDGHILDFLKGTKEASGDRRDISEFTPELMADEIALHRQRSVHVHVWNYDEFTEVLAHSGRELGLRFEVVDAMAPGAKGTHGDEFGWVLARADTATVRGRRSRRFPFGRNGRLRASIF
jgi:SAM-dependent methyltransferase